MARRIQYDVATRDVQVQSLSCVRFLLDSKHDSVLRMTGLLIVQLLCILWRNGQCQIIQKKIQFCERLIVVVAQNNRGKSTFWNQLNGEYDAKKVYSQMVEYASKSTVASC